MNELLKLIADKVTELSYQIEYDTISPQQVDNKIELIQQLWEKFKEDSWLLQYIINDR